MKKIKEAMTQGQYDKLSASTEEIKKELRDTIIDPEEAIDRLLSLGFSHSRAVALVDEWGADKYEPYSVWSKIKVNEASLREFKVEKRGNNINYYESVIGKDRPRSLKESIAKFSGYVLGKKELPRLNEAKGPSARDLIEVMYDSEFEYGKGYGKKSDDEYLYSLPDWLLDQIQNRWYKIQKDKRNAAKPKVVSQDMEESTLKEVTSKIEEVKKGATYPATMKKVKDILKALNMEAQFIDKRTHDYRVSIFRGVVNGPASPQSIKNLQKKLDAAGYSDIKAQRVGTADRLGFLVPILKQDLKESTLKEAAEPAVDIVARAVAILVDDYGYDENEAFNVVHDMSDPYELDDQYRNRGANEEVIEELADSIVHLVIKA